MADTQIDPDALTYDANGLIPAIVIDHDSREVLMMAWMNPATLARTIDEGETVFWSRSRHCEWHKGATSGNTQRVIAIQTDCDQDTLLIEVEPAGPACHRGTRTCFTQPVWAAKP